MRRGGVGRLDYETETLLPVNGGSFDVAPVASSLDAHYGSKRGLENQHIQQDCPLYVAHALRAEGFDASEDGTGRGTPIVPEHPFTLAIRGRGDSHQLEYSSDGSANAVLTPNGGRAGIGVGAICFDETQVTSKTNRSQPLAGDPSHPLAAGARAPTIAFNARQDPDSGPVSHPLDTDGSTIGIFSNWRVRRLTPTECERLQGFPDGYTNVPYRRSNWTPDGPRYKALGNSMAVNVMRWIGRRIEMVEAIK